MNVLYLVGTGEKKGPREQMSAKADLSISKPTLEQIINMLREAGVPAYL